MSTPQQRKGRAAELAVAKWLQELWPHAEPTRRSGWSDDRGDIDGIPGIVIEVKNCRKFDLPGWLTELETEIGNANASTGVLVIKRRGSTDPADWYAVTRLVDWAHLAKDAGW